MLTQINLRTMFSQKLRKTILYFNVLRKGYVSLYKTQRFLVQWNSSSRNKLFDMKSYEYMKIKCMFFSQIFHCRPHSFSCAAMCTRDYGNRHFSAMPRQIPNMHKVNLVKIFTNCMPCRTYFSSVKHNNQESTVENFSESNEQFSNLSQNDPETAKKIQLILMECEVARQSGFKAPSVLREKDMKELLLMDSRSARRKYFTFLFKKEVLRISEKEKKELKRAERALKKAETSAEDKHSEYGLGRNTIFLYIRESTMNKFYNHKMASAMIYGQKIVVDLDYSSHMTKRECMNTADQLQELYAVNKCDEDPFDLYFCNAHPENQIVQFLTKTIPNLREYNCFITTTPQSYLDIFPKEKLVYLTPHTRNPLKEYDHEAVYIIGGMVDKGIQKPISLAKAKKEGLKMAKLPLDLYLSWGLGSKSLTLNQVMQILLEVKKSGNWSKALKYVPRRKLMKQTL
ncbi:mitochondrial ribonuclease P protein 1 homolog [Limulus polyphemus]|uniref:RNA (guanine-9-)-methyltransferase domain-containing protein 1 n=1 Tax=Limulus polyphemus TaxID=6850 RepID=A0ABM1B6U2_LIMPO|nr:mitochondrial ribonuclease P protein 1 homolog [Limulus polyphemus]XP_013775972.1 mitochondrial ribonuclease P protein 1 homolog [Limulus polyphemus]